ncbi:hypothetical protein BC830DRAFT_1144632 [Chytriomyces sp. MP71]|nr:hypothetical protein BC830DRAFT_1144632 [Chytriomyces sp. MP71]
MQPLSPIQGVTFHSLIMGGHEIEELNHVSPEMEEQTDHSKVKKIGSLAKSVSDDDEDSHGDSTLAVGASSTKAIYKFGGNVSRSNMTETLTGSATASSGMERTRKGSDEESGRTVKPPSTVKTVRQAHNK